MKRWKAYLNNPLIAILEDVCGVKGKHICDVGCAYGDFLQQIRHRGGHPFGVELDVSARDFLSKIAIPNAESLSDEGE